MHVSDPVPPLVSDSVDDQIIDVVTDTQDNTPQEFVCPAHGDALFTHNVSRVPFVPFSTPQPSIRRGSGEASPVVSSIQCDRGVRRVIHQEMVTSTAAVSDDGADGAATSVASADVVMTSGRSPLPPGRVADIRTKIFSGAYHSLDIAEQIARAILQRDDLSSGR